MAAVTRVSLMNSSPVFNPDLLRGRIAGLASTVIGNAIEKARMTNQVVEISEQEYEL